MTKPGRPSSPAVRKSPLRHRLHRATGLVTGVMLLYLIATGLPLQLTHPLDLGGRYVASPTVLDWYGIRPPDSGWRSGPVRQAGNLLFHDRAVLTEVDGLTGAVVNDGFLVVATTGTLLVVSPDEPAAIDSIPLPTGSTRIGRMGQQVILETGRGLLALDLGTLTLRSTAAAPGTEWAEVVPLRPDELAPYREPARSRVLTLERLLQDLHSGRAFGWPGELLVTLMSLALAVLAASGFWIWWRSR